MNSETKTCQNCKNNFIIDADDFMFYAKIDVPPPTFCPECRMQRRMLFYNDRALFKGKCDLCEKEVISSHRPDAPHPVYCQPCWWSDTWEATDYGREYDPNRSFFQQWRELRDVVPLPALNNIYASNVNSEYVNMCSYLKNCYLLFTSDFDEECAYSSYLEQSKRCCDCDHALQCELCYDCIGLYKCYRVVYSNNVTESLDVLFSQDLRNCSHCFGCINLRGKQYCMFNEQMSRERYFEKLKTYDLTSRDVVEDLKKKTAELFFKHPHKYMTGVGNADVTGDRIFWSKRVFDSYEIVVGEDMKYCQLFIIGGSKNCMDVTMWGSNLIEAYECCAVGNNQNNVIGSLECWNEVTNMFYCKNIVSPNADIFGCIGLRNKQYCILNKQYEPDAYKKLSAQIIEKMKKDGEWGEFFPPQLSLCGYNESFANKYVPITKQEALAKGFRWTEPEKRDYQIGGDVIGCEHKGECGQQCTGAFKLTQNEKDFYQQMQIPTPRLCPNCRHYERMKLRNPIKLYSRKCMKCGKDIETSYAPERPEIVYCESCYNSEIN